MTEEQILKLQTQRDIESKRLANLSKTRSFFRDGFERVVTIGNIVDINKQKDKISSINSQIEELRNPKPKVTTKISTTKNSSDLETSDLMSNQTRNTIHFVPVTESQVIGESQKPNAGLILAALGILFAIFGGVF